MVSPNRKRDSSSPRKAKRHFARDEPQDTGLDASFDLFDLDGAASQWYSIRIPGLLPKKRSFHSSTLLNNKYVGSIKTIIRLYVIGGIDLMEDSFADVWVLDASKIAPLLGKQPKVDTELWQLLPTTGEAPGRITSHKTVVIGNIIYTYGGIIENDNQVQSLFSLDVTKGVWTKIVSKVKYNLLIISRIFLLQEMAIAWLKVKIILFTFLVDF